MPIVQVSPLPAGTALRVTLSPARAAASWILLRRADADFVGAADPDALVVLANSPALWVIDYAGLTNGTAAFYQLYSSPGAGAPFAADGPPVSATPAAFYSDAAPDPQEVLQARIAAGIAVEVAAGNLVPGLNAGGVIPVLIAPYALSDEIIFPMVTIHLDDTSPSSRYIGDNSAFDMMDANGLIVETEGWLASYSLNVVGMTLNGDERIALRKALRRIVQANLPIFDQAGMVEISFSQADNEDFESKAATLYMTAGRFTCMAPAAVTTSAAPATAITLTANLGTDVVNG